MRSLLFVAMAGLVMSDFAAAQQSPPPQQPFAPPMSTQCAVQSLRSPMKKIEMKSWVNHPVSEIESAFEPAFKSFDQDDARVYVFVDGAVFKDSGLSPPCGYVLIYRAKDGNVTGLLASMAVTSRQQYDDYMRTKFGQ